MTEGIAGVGAELARAREERGLALADVAQHLKFGLRQLEALEEDRFDALPGSTFARGMVRSYARLLKIDAEPLLARMSVLPVPDAGRLAERYREPVPFSDSARRSTFLYLGLSVGVLAIGGAVAYEWVQERGARVQVAMSTASAPAPEKEASAEAAEPAAPPAVAAAPAKPAAARPAAPERQQLSVALDSVKAAPPPGGRHRIVLRFEEEAWAEVRDGAERLLVSSLNPAGTERVVRGQPPFSLVIGNAHHVQVTYNDKPVDLQPYVKVEVARFTLQ